MRRQVLALARCVAGARFAAAAYGQGPAFGRFFEPSTRCNAILGLNATLAF